MHIRTPKSLDICYYRKENVFLPHIHSKWTYYPLPSLEEMSGRKRDLQIGKHTHTVSDRVERAVLQ